MAEAPCPLLFLQLWNLLSSVGLLVSETWLFGVGISTCISSAVYLKLRPLAVELESMDPLWPDGVMSAPLRLPVATRGGTPFEALSAAPHT